MYCIYCFRKSGKYVPIRYFRTDSTTRKFETGWRKVLKKKSEIWRVNVGVIEDCTNEKCDRHLGLCEKIVVDKIDGSKTRFVEITSNYDRNL